jgi:hypothetical protein
MIKSIVFAGDVVRESEHLWLIVHYLDKSIQDCMMISPFYQQGVFSKLGHTFGFHKLSCRKSWPLK